MTTRDIASTDEVDGRRRTAGEDDGARGDGGRGETVVDGTGRADRGRWAVQRVWRLTGLQHGTARGQGRATRRNEDGRSATSCRHMKPIKDEEGSGQIKEGGARRRGDVEDATATCSSRRTTPRGTTSGRSRTTGDEATQAGVDGTPGTAPMRGVAQRPGSSSDAVRAGTEASARASCGRGGADTASGAHRGRVAKARRPGVGRRLGLGGVHREGLLGLEVGFYVVLW